MPALWLEAVLMLCAVMLIMVTFLVRIIFNWTQLGHYAGGRLRETRFRGLLLADVMLASAGIVATLLCGFAPILIQIDSPYTYWAMLLVPIIVSYGALLYTLVQQSFGSRTLLRRLGERVYRQDSTCTGPIRVAQPHPKLPYNTGLDGDIVDPD